MRLRWNDMSMTHETDIINFKLSFNDNLLILLLPSSSINSNVKCKLLSIDQSTSRWWSRTINYSCCSNSTTWWFWITFIFKKFQKFKVIRLMSSVVLWILHFLVWNINHPSVLFSGYLVSCDCQINWGNAWFRVVE